MNLKYSSGFCYLQSKAVVYRYCISYDLPLNSSVEDTVNKTLKIYNTANITMNDNVLPYSLVAFACIENALPLST